MRLKKSTVWSKQWFDETSVPAPETIKKWVVEGFVPGCIIAGTIYIAEDDWLASVTNKALPTKVTKISARQLLEG